jgi:hypothetical protein
MKSDWRAPLLVLLTLPAAALAQQPSAPSSSSAPVSPSTSSASSVSAPPSFDSLDTNHDGVLSKDEFMAGVANANQNASGSGRHDGHHGPGGYGGGANPNGGGFGGGGFGGGGPGGFGGHPPGGGGFGGSGTGGGHHHSGGGAQGERLNPTQQFEDLDTDHNGVLSREEFAARTQSGGVSSAASTPPKATDAGDASKN